MSVIETQSMPSRRRLRIFGALLGAWIVLVIVGGIAYRYAYRDTFPVPVPPLPTGSPPTEKR